MSRYCSFDNAVRSDLGRRFTCTTDWDILANVHCTRIRAAGIFLINLNIVSLFCPLIMMVFYLVI